MANMLKICILAIIASIAISACSGNEESFYDLDSVKNCDASESACTVSGKDFNIKLKLGPNVVPLKSFPVELAITNSDEVVPAANVIIDFQMTGMDMGLNRYKLSNSGNLWNGVVTLPVCVASRMDWIAIVEFTAQNRRYRAVFPFHTDRS